MENTITKIQDVTKKILIYWKRNTTYIPEEIKYIYCDLKTISFECTRFTCIDKKNYLIQKINKIQNILKDTLIFWNKNKSIIPKEMTNIYYDIQHMSTLCEHIKKTITRR